jgi:hypothetical protein
MTDAKRDRIDERLRERDKQHLMDEILKDLAGADKAINQAMRHIYAVGANKAFPETLSKLTDIDNAIDDLAGAIKGGTLD